jgi:beta-galactosidase
MAFPSSNISGSPPMSFSLPFESFRFPTLATLAIALLFPWVDGESSGTRVQAQEIVDSWRVQFRRPMGDWQAPSFDDSDWQTASGGFGTHETPAARIGTVWGTDNIWLRKRIPVAAVPAKPALLIHHDEDAEVYLNGKRVAQLKGYVTDYKVVPIEPSDRSAINVGDNLMAVHCRQSGGGQFIDVHLIDADRVPKLPPAKRSTTPFISELITKWGAEVNAENAWNEYPRPRVRREAWTNLNGLWDYAITPVEQVSIPETWTGKILVPFALESKLGGVQRLLDSSEALWYHRNFEFTPAKSGEVDQPRQILHFEAVDYRCEVFVNGTKVGSHRGGNTPFSFDITNALQAGSNSLVVRVEDETEGWQLRGKQTLNARGIWYTQVSGIWQTVWMETVPTRHIQDLKIQTNHANGEISVSTLIAPTANESPSLTKRLRVKDGGQVVAEASSNESTIVVTVPDAKLWSPASPFLYDLEVTLLDPQGQVVDRVDSYAGIRTVGKTKDADGHWRFTLNGEEIFHWGPLDQGWWPDGLLTPPSDEAMKFDIQWLKDAGFNMIRKHIKVEPRRYYYHCDKIGMMLWQDQVSGGAQPEWTRLAPNPVDAQWPDEEHDQFMLELDRMITLLESHPSIVVWVPFNEAWGQHRTMDVGKWVVERDPSRLVNIASGGNFWPVGDVVDHHQYPHPAFPFELGAGGRFDDYVKVMGEFGGHGLPIPNHLWDANRRNWGYGDLPKSPEEYKERYITSLKMLNDLRAQGIAAGVYTQTTDVEGEINGLMTYDRKVIKLDADELASRHKILFEPIRTK